LEKRDPGKCLFSQSKVSEYTAFISALLDVAFSQIIEIWKFFFAGREIT
jgi:hypothetical protein